MKTPGWAVLFAVGSAALLGTAVSSAAPSAPSRETIARAASGDAAAAGEIEERLSPLFEKKDLDAMSETAVGQEAARLLGLEPAPPVLWRAGGGPDAARILAIDLGSSSPAAGSPSGAASGAPSGATSGYVAYAIVERLTGGSTKDSRASVAWYHDTGRKLSEQGGDPWHPVSATFLGGGRPGDKRGVAVAEAARPGSPAVGVLVLESEGAGRWSASRRLSAPGGSRGVRLVAVGEGGAVFIAPREAPKGVLTGAPAELFRSIVLYERTAGAFADVPTVSAIPDAVTATETLLATLRRGDKAGAVALCRSPDVLEALLYFSPSWKGGGRIVSAAPDRVEFRYEEQGRPTLRMELTFVGSGGSLVLASASGRAEGGS